MSSPKNVHHVRPTVHMEKQQRRELKTSRVKVETVIKCKEINQGLTKDNVTYVNYNLKQDCFQSFFPVARHGCHTDN